MNFISGQWCGAASGATYERANPARLNDVIGNYPESGPADAERAAKAAWYEFDQWRNSPAAARAAVLTRAAAQLRDTTDSIGAVLTREEGKPIALARTEVLRAADVFEYFAGAALRIGGQTLPSTRAGVDLATHIEPIGPVLLITPFNFPLFVPALKIGPALVAGNTVVWKPSPHVPATSIALVEALRDAGLPAGVVNLVLGSTAELGQALVDDPRIQAISFTGSTAVGLDIGVRAAGRHVRVQQEMGGKNVLIVGPDFDVESAARIAADSAFGESGQKCTAAGIVVVDLKRRDEFLHEVKQILAGLRMGDGADPAVDLGPLVDRSAVAKAGRLLDAAVGQGAVVEAAGCGQMDVTSADGHYFAPAVVSLPDTANPLRTTEAFAPIMPVITATNAIEEGLSVIDSGRMGLSASLLAGRLDLTQSFVRRARAGLVSVNLPTTGVEYQAPFGGWNLSGGPFPEAGTDAVDFYTRTKTVAINA